ncbi:MAG: hypothetical protein P1V51_05230 [Deltaproteobacteria bacterium]|nr:hypothetical protein [Deltaproteobacteria bacterium]
MKRRIPLKRPGHGGAAGRIVAALGSLLLLSGAALGLQQWLRALSGERPRVEVTPPGPVLQLPTVIVARGEARKGSFTLDGAPVPEGLQKDRRTVMLGPADLTPGLHQLAWKQTFVGQRERGVSLGMMVGPFREAGEATPCALKATVRQAALDTFSPELSLLVREKAAAVKGLPKIVRSEARLLLVEGGLDAQTKVTFADGSELQAIVPLALAPKLDAPVQVKLRGDVKVDVSGAVGAMASLKGGGLLAALAEVVQRPERGLEGALSAARQAGNEVVRAEVQGALEGWLSRFDEELKELFPTELSTELLGVRARLTLTPCGTPKVRPGKALILRHGIGLAIDAEGLAPPSAAADLPGPVRREGAELDGRTGPGAAPISLQLSPAAIDAFLDAAWRSGALSLLGADPELVRRTNARLAGRVSFRLRSVELRLPPVLELGGAQSLLRASEATLHLEEQEAGPVDLVLSGAASLEAKVGERTMVLTARATGVEGSCRRDDGDTEVREPCYPELLSALSDVLVTQGTLSHERGSALGLSRARVWVSGVGLDPEGLKVDLQVQPTP